MKLDLPLLTALSLCIEIWGLGFSKQFMKRPWCGRSSVAGCK
jgi:hypothetical protein